MNVLHAVIYVRLSRTTESSTSLARQEASCRGYAERQGWTVLRVFQDSNVSGGEPPGERPALRELCENLSHYDVLLTPSAWTHKSIKIVMTSQTVLGHKIEHRTGKVICDNAGPVKFWPPMLTQEEFARIAQIIEDGYRPRRPNRPSHWLHGVVICGVCGRNMKRSQSSGAETFRCLGPLTEPHRSVSIKGDLLEGWFIAELRERLRNAPVVEHTYRAEVDLSDEIRRLRTYGRAAGRPSGRGIQHP
ncbi:recombinase family protein [Streptomyces sp. NPDC051658]|uniref:recombinase family protein n=1 Tax=Streptomyces sp. NPDC051658 TaxID=3365667 RepID=UPI0037ACBDA9